MKKQHQMKNQRCGNFQNLTFHLMLFFFASNGLKSVSVREPDGCRDNRRAAEEPANITRICAESLVKNQYQLCVPLIRSSNVT